MSVAQIFEGWHKTQAHLINRLPKLGPIELNLRASTEGWPIWAIVSHLAGARVYWLCGVLNEAGAATTPFPDASGEGWEDHLDVPRGSAELMFAIESSGQIIESGRARGTPEMPAQAVLRERGSEIQWHTRQSVLTRIVMHDAFHCGEVSSLLGAHGFASMDPWDPIP